MILHFTTAKTFRLVVYLLVLTGIQCLAAPTIGITTTPSWIIPVSPSGKAPTAKQFSDGYYVSFSDLQVNLELKTTYTRSVRQIVSESGIQNGSEISVVFDPVYEKVDFHSITIWRNGVSIPQLNTKDFKIMAIETDRQRFIYNGYFSASVVLKDIRKGDRIEYSYSRKGWNPVFQDKYSGIFDFGVYDYSAHLHYAVIAKTGRKIYFKDFNNPPAKTIRHANGTDLYEWELKNVKSIKYDDYTPTWFEKQPFVQLTEFKDWQEVVDWGLQFYPKPVLSGPLQAKVKEWQKKSEGSKLNYMDQAVRFVQDEIRYLGIETGENSHRPHHPNEVFSQRYGDCKDKAYLLCALLNANNIESDPLLVNTYKKKHIQEFLPSPTDFNHVVVRVRVREEGPHLNDADAFRFVDATSSMQGSTFSMISFPAYGAGLLLKKGQKKLLPVALQNSGNITLTEEFLLPPQGDTAAAGLLMVKTVYFQGEADSYRVQFQSSVVTDLEEKYLNFYRDTYKNMQLEMADTLEYYDQREAGNFSLIERYKIKNVWSYDSTGKKYYTTFLGKSLYDQLLILPNRARKDPLYLNYPYHINYTIRVHMPENWNVPAETWNLEREAYIIGFKSEYIAHEKIWQLDYEYKTREDFIPASQIAQYNKDVEKLVANLEYNLSKPDLEISKPGNLNAWMVFLVLITVAGSYFLFRRLYQYSPLQGFQKEEAIEIKSWLILIGIGIVAQPFKMLISLYNSSGVFYFTQSGWDSMIGMSDGKLLSYRLLLILETAGNTVMICFAVLLAVLYFRKRDSFPLLYSVFLASNLLFLIADVTVIYAFRSDTNLTFDDSTRTIVGQLIGAAIWIPYMFKSERVKATFVNAYEPDFILESSQDAEVIENI